MQMEFGNGVALLARDQIDLRQKLPISRALSIEVVTERSCVLRTAYCSGSFVSI
jgi:hypothetical protein